MTGHSWEQMKEMYPRDMRPVRWPKYRWLTIAPWLLTAYLLALGLLMMGVGR